MTDIVIRGLIKSFEVGENILDGIDLEITAGERVGLLGQNGAGKTTLFRILTGELQADEGQAAVWGSSAKFRNTLRAIPPRTS